MQLISISSRPDVPPCIGVESVVAERIEVIFSSISFICCGISDNDSFTALYSNKSARAFFFQSDIRALLFHHFKKIFRIYACKPREPFAKYEPFYFFHRPRGIRVFGVFQHLFVCLFIVLHCLLNYLLRKKFVRVNFHLFLLDVQPSLRHTHSSMAASSSIDLASVVCIRCTSLVPVATRSSRQTSLLSTPHAPQAQ